MYKSSEPSPDQQPPRAGSLVVQGDAGSPRRSKGEGVPMAYDSKTYKIHKHFLFCRTQEVQRKKRERVQKNGHHQKSDYHQKNDHHQKNGHHQKNRHRKDQKDRLLTKLHIRAKENHHP